MWEAFKSVLNEMIEKHVPERRQREIGKPKWLDMELTKQIEKKRKPGIRTKRLKRTITRPCTSRSKKKTKKMIKNKKMD